MNRRAFLGSIVALGSLPLLSTLPLEILQRTPYPGRLLLEGDGALIQFTYVSNELPPNDEDVPQSREVGIASIYRGDSLLFRAGLSTHLSWRADLGCEIIFTKRHPVTILLPRHGQCCAIYESSGRIYTRSMSPSGRLEAPQIL